MSNQQKTTIGESIQGVVDNLVEKGGAAVEMVKEWAGMEVTDDIDQIKKKATQMNADQVHFKEEMQHELKATHKAEKPVAIKEEYKAQRDVIEKAQLINPEQVGRKEEMLNQLTKENKATPGFDEKTLMDKMTAQFDTTTMYNAMDKAKEVWDTTTSIVSEKTGEAVEKVKEMTGMVNTNDPEYIKGKAMKMNPDQAKMKHTMHRELLSENEPEKPIEMPKGQEKEIQKQRKQQMQKELTKENKEIPAFDANTRYYTVDRAKDLLGATTSTIAEKTGTAVDKVKEWTGMKDTKETIQQIKDKAVDKNPEQAKMKSQMQKELLDQNKKESPVASKKEYAKTGKDDKAKESFQKATFEKERKFGSDKEKKQYEEQLRASEKSNSAKPVF